MNSNVLKTKVRVGLFGVAKPVLLSDYRQGGYPVKNSLIAQKYDLLRVWRKNVKTFNI